MSDMRIEIFHSRPDAPLYRQVWQLREDVLRQPLGLSLRDEDPEAEQTQLVFAAVRQEGNDVQVTGCLMMVPDYRPRVAKLRQMAVSPEAQGQGTGRELMREAERYCRAQDYRQIVLHARRSAEDFYAKLGYITDGAPFDEVTIPHVLMRKDL